MSSKNTQRDDARAFLLVMAGALIMVAIAWIVGMVLKAPMLARFSLSLADSAIGLIATAPLIVLLFWFMRTDLPMLVKFRESQIDFFAKIGFRFTPLRIALLAISAGVSEELLFRGVLQSWIASALPVSLAIILPNIAFGALHARTSLYAFIAGMVGVYMGLVFAATDNVLAPIITHAAYDWAALIITQRAIAARIGS